jgi:hypothetical protein
MDFITKLKTLLIAFTISVSQSAFADISAISDCPDNNRVNQAFSFGGYGENQDVEIMYVEYGIPGCPPNYDSKKLLFNGKTPQSTNIVGGPARRAWVLNVKWRIMSTGKEYEKKVELRNRLPEDMTNNRIHFSIEESELFVYLITSEKRLNSMPAIGPKPYQSLRTEVIFPDKQI